MKGKYAIDVEGLPEINTLVQEKARKLMGYKDGGGFDNDKPLLLVDLEKQTVKSPEKTLEEYDVMYGLGGYQKISVVDFLRLSRPVPQVALGLVITEDLDNPHMGEPRMVTEADLKEFDFDITRSHIMAAAEQACSALGV